MNVADFHTAVSQTARAKPRRRRLLQKASASDWGTGHCAGPFLFWTIEALRPAISIKRDAGQPSEAENKKKPRLKPGLSRRFSMKHGTLSTDCPQTKATGNSIVDFGWTVAGLQHLPRY
jgi:hypothetical protein